MQKIEQIIFWYVVWRTLNIFFHFVEFISIFPKIDCFFINTVRAVPKKKKTDARCHISSGAGANNDIHSKYSWISNIDNAHTCSKLNKNAVFSSPSNRTPICTWNWNHLYALERNIQSFSVISGRQKPLNMLKTRKVEQARAF